MAEQKVVDRKERRAEVGTPVQGNPAERRGNPFFRMHGGSEAAPAPQARPLLRCFHDPQNDDAGIMAFNALMMIRMHRGTEKELRQSVGLGDGGEATSEKLRAMIKMAGKLDYGDQVVAAAIMKFSLFIAERDGKVDAALEDVRGDAGLPWVVSNAIEDALYLLGLERK